MGGGVERDEVQATRGICHWILERGSFGNPKFGIRPASAVI